MATMVYIAGLSGRGFRVRGNTATSGATGVPAGGTGWKVVKENVIVAVDLEDAKTRAILAREKDNYIRVTDGNSLVANLVGLTRYGFRVRGNTGDTGATGVTAPYKTVKAGITGGGLRVQALLADGRVRRVLKRNYGRYVRSQSSSSVDIRGLQEKQNGFPIHLGFTSSAAPSITLDSAAANADLTFTSKVTGAAGNGFVIIKTTGLSGSTTVVTTTVGATSTIMITLGATAAVSAATVKTAVDGATGTTGASVFVSVAVQGSGAGTVDAGLSGTVTGGNTGVNNVARVYRNTGPAAVTTVSLADDFNVAQLRRHYKSWIEA